MKSVNNICLLLVHHCVAVSAHVLLRLNEPEVTCSVFAGQVSTDNIFCYFLVIIRTFSQ